MTASHGVSLDRLSREKRKTHLGTPVGDLPVMEARSPGGGSSMRWGSREMNGWIMGTQPWKGFMQASWD